MPEPRTERRETGDATRRARARLRRRSQSTRLDEAQVVQLVERARSGDRDAFGRLYEEYRAQVFNLARFSLQNPAAEDVVGETFARAWAALPRYRFTGAPFVAWVYGIARHVVADAKRNAGRCQPVDEPDGPEPDGRDLVPDRLDLRKALGDLPEEQRTVIELKYFAGLNNGEVAAALGKSPGAVNAQQWRALTALRELIGER